MIAEVDPEAGRVPTPDVPYPAGLMIAQWRVEQILRERLADFGVAVELGAELRSLRQHADGVTATVGEAGIRARYLVGCDGGRSTVRKALGLTLRGETPDVQLMAVGDVEVDGLEPGRLAPVVHRRRRDHALPASRHQRLPGAGIARARSGRRPAGADAGAFQQTFDRIAAIPGVRLRSLAWRSSYRVNVRMVDQLQVGRVFLAGDAAHVHPIAGGLGMNSGIQDAYNLGWKLGLVLAGHATPGLLATYEEERLPIASWLLDITSERLSVVLDAIKETGGGVDAVASPELTQLHARDTRGAGSPATPQADPPDPSRATGHRTRRCATPPPARRIRLFDLFRGPHFTLLGLGERSAAPALTRRSNTHGASSSPTLSGQAASSTTTGTRPAHTATDALILVRPDGYIGLIADADDTSAVAGYLRSL